MTDWINTSHLDRLELLRNDPERVAQLWADPAAVVVEVGVGTVAGGPGGLASHPTKGDYDPQRHYLLGSVAGQVWFATAGSTAQVALRSVMDSLPDSELEAAFTGVGLFGWHHTHQFCPACGFRTQVVAGGMSRFCPNCGQEHYPRTDPAVIVAILDDRDRLLLGRQPGWIEGRHSVFAGFAEVGESLEQAVRREIAEEVGLGLQQVSYLASQPWPFPRSLMVAFSARAEPGELRVDHREIETAAWYTPEQVRTRLGNGFSLPPTTSIARRMIETWLRGELNP